MSTNKIYHYYLTRAEYNAATKSDYAIYFVAEMDGRITIYRGTQKTSDAIRFVSSFPQVGEQGIFFFQPSTGIMKIWATQWVQIFPQEVGGTINWDDVLNKPSFSTVATSGSYNDLSNKPTIPEAQIQSDWNQSSASEKDYIKNKPTIPSSSDYIPQSQKGTANGVPTLNSSAKIPYSQLPDGKPITTIPAATSTYTLADGCYIHTPSAAPTYTLPAVTDATKTHWVVLTVSFASTQSIAFEDAQGTIIVPLDTLTIATNDVVEYLCQYDSLQGKWVIVCGKLTQ